MINKFIFWAMLFLSLAANSQLVPVDPDPGCKEIERFGVIQENSQNTAYFIGGIGSIDDDSGCSGLMANIGYGSLNPSEVAFGAIDADLIDENGPGDVDFSIDLAETFVGMPYGGEVKIAELYSSHLLMADLTLKKHIIAATSMATVNQNSDPYGWLLTVKWYTNNAVQATIEDTFNFAYDDVIAYNYYVNETDPEAPVAVIQVGRRSISENPYYGQTGLVAVDVNGSVNQLSHQLETYFLGVIETSVIIPEFDQISFDLNWTLPGVSIE